MFGGKKNIPPEQGRDRRQVQRSGEGRPAFSYYSSNRTPETVNTARHQERSERATPQATGKQGRRLPRISPQYSFWVLVLLAVVCILKVLMLSTNPKVVVLGNSPATQAYLQPTGVYQSAAQKLLTHSLTNRSKLTINLDGTAASLKKEFPELESVSLDVPLVGSRPIVYIQVAQPTLIVQNGHGNYALNAAGFVLARLTTVPSNIPVIADPSGSMLKPGTHFLPSSEVTFIHTVAYQFSAAHISVATFEMLPESPYELDVRLQGNSYVIRFNLQEDALTQSGAAIATVQQYGQKPTRYIDVRVPGRVYLK